MVTNCDESILTIRWKFEEVLQREWKSDWKFIIRWIKSQWKLWKIYSYTVLTSYWWMGWEDWPLEKIQFISIYGRRDWRKNKIKICAPLLKGAVMKWLGIFTHHTTKNPPALRATSFQKGGQKNLLSFKTTNEN